MKLKRLLATLLTVALVAALVPAGALAGPDPSSWAVPEMREANTSGLLTGDAAADYARSMTRDQFCEIVVLLTEKTLGRELALPMVNPFTDTVAKHVLKANAYGIVNGVTTTTFEPHSPVTREQIALMMNRAMLTMQAQLGRTLLEPPAAAITFKDAGKLWDESVSAVKYAVSNGIFQGDENNNFNPKDNITSQECVAVVLRSFNAMQTRIDAGLTTVQLLEKAVGFVNIGYALGDAANAVSRDIVLPTRSSGGSVVTWTSSNSAVIDNMGRVNPNGTAVTLLATISLGGQTRTKSFSLTTTTLAGTALHIQNARAALEISYRNVNDSANSVTGNVFLPDSVLGLPVVWSTDRPATVTNRGIVTVPTSATPVTVNLTASFVKDGQSGTKTFMLTVRNPAYASTGASLHNIKFGMTSAQVNTALGSGSTAAVPKSTLTLTSGETWNFYYTSTTSYTNFVAVAFRSDKVIGIYSMIPTWANYLYDATNTTRRLTVSEANQLPDTRLTTYSLGSTQYAAFMVDTTSTAATSRVLNATSAEAFTLMLINAYRAVNGTTTGGRAVLQNDAQLANSARNHSIDMGTYDYFSAIGRSNNSTYITRATAAGFTKTVENGIIANNEINPFDFFNQAVQSSTERAKILSSTATVAGIGYAGGYTGTHRSLVTTVFGMGTVTRINSVTANPTSVSISVNRTATVDLSFAPTNFDEAFSVESSNEAAFTVGSATTPSVGVRRYTLTAKAAASTTTYYLYVKGADGRTIASIPVTIGSKAYANSMTLRNESNTDVVTGTSAITAANATASHTYVMGVGDTYRFTASTVNGAGSPTVSWAVGTNGRATINATSGAATTVTGVSAGSTTLTVTVPNHATNNTTIRVTINIIVVAKPTLTPANSGINVGAVQNLTLNGMPTAAGYNNWNYNWVSSAPNIAQVAFTNNTASVTGITGNASPVTIRPTATLISTTHIAKISLPTATVTVTGNSDYATSIKVSGQNTMEVGQSLQLSAMLTPTTVTHNTVTWGSSDPSVATVSAGGLVTALRAGTVTIDGAVQANADGNMLTDELTINISEFTPTAIVFTQSPLLSVDTGNVPLVYTIATAWNSAGFSPTELPVGVPPITVTFESSDPSVVTVDANGRISAHGVADTAVISAKIGTTVFGTITVVVSDI